jgi:hypothetical protein
MHPDLEAARAAIDAATMNMTADELSRHAPGKWSSAQVLEHLAKAYGSTAYILDKCVREHRSVATPQSPRQRVFAWILVCARRCAGVADRQGGANAANQPCPAKARAGVRNRIVR